MRLGYSDWLGGAEGASSRAGISPRTGLPPAEEFAVLAHELAHSILHLSDGPRTESKTERETEAEVAAFVVCQAIGLDTDAASADYLSLHGGDKEVLAESLGRIQPAAARIIEGLQRETSDDTAATVSEPEGTILLAA